ncbi:transcriptional regulator [Paenibacillus jamilae]|uniref:Transcriptional regulator n=1 Tax=Paenibacillus jamilae TaxID=114136 RepID=A0ACC4ZVJ2_9BACL|nr:MULTISPECIES: TetR/AcrR family transcriptional regulator [Paenibacillus]AJE52928.1 transcriptional regulator [Paenibacillus polymyxa]AUO07742.1 TetR/AcrR family transcriptional regulator [Paenibacillus sp. lzh-N1]AZH30659.1 TetR/AcrR family transcriptional regulator [Paenibacillus sp. M-152]KTS82647.1 transcriptional regulator [Paenibacillus jamilae]MBU9705452.1 TetR/AcrR family transcriptional regulator [Paenibacillus sp. AK121]
MNKKTHVDSKKKDILQAAMCLFATKGIDGISVKEIAEAAGVTDAAIYKHFKSKDAMALEVFGQYCNSYTTLIDFYRKQNGSFLSRFHQLVDEVLNMHDEDQYGLLLLSQHHELYVEASQNQNVRQPLEALTEFIEQGIQQGELPKQDVQLSGVLIIGAITRLSVSSLEGELPQQLVPFAVEIKQRLTALLSKGQ